MTLTLPDALAAILVIALNAYVLLGGADFGGGVWDLLATGEKSRVEKQRALIARSIGPIWEANHVWLILVVVLFFTCFPAAFAQVSVILHIPLALLLVGVVLRGSAFIFRSYDAQRDDVQTRWGLIFSLSSVFTPALLGISAGALATGDVGTAFADSSASFVARFVLPWANPFVISVGVLTLTLVAYLAAVYSTVAAEGDAQLQRDFRRRALGAWAAVLITAFLTLALSTTRAPRMMVTLVHSWAALPLHLAMATSALIAVTALVTRRYRAARIAAAAQVSFAIWGWALTLRPYLVPPTLTIEAAAAPPITLRLTLVALAIGALVLIPSLVYLFRLFVGGTPPFRHRPADQD